MPDFYLGLQRFLAKFFQNIAKFWKIRPKTLGDLNQNLALIKDTEMTTSQVVLLYHHVISLLSKVSQFPSCSIPRDPKMRYRELIT